MIDSIIKPLEPRGEGWQTGGDVRRVLRSAYPVVQWFHVGKGLGVLSAVEVASDGPGMPDKGPEYHVSISKPIPGSIGIDRCSADEAKWVLEQFGLDGAEEDNHVPNGKVRNFWRPVAEPLIGLDCACKETENKVVEGDFESRPLPLTASLGDTRRE